MVGVDGVTVLDGLYLANEKGLLVGTTFCAPLTDQVGGGRDLRVCCGTCYSSIDARGKKLSICRRCGDHLFCEACLAGDGPARHARECARVRSLVRGVARTMLPRVRESARTTPRAASAFGRGKTKRRSTLARWRVGALARREARS